MKADYDFIDKFNPLQLYYVNLKADLAAACAECEQLRRESKLLRKMYCDEWVDEMTAAGRKETT